jgi:DNA-binding protein H-NS
MARTSAKRTKKSAPVKRTPPVRQAAKQVAVDAEPVRPDLDNLLKSLDVLSVASLQQVADQALALIREKTEQDKRTLIGVVTARAISLGESITGLFTKSADEAVAGANPSSAVRYRGPDGRTWTGKGKLPKWLAQLEANGKKREGYAV